MFLSLVDIEEVCMEHVYLPLIKGLVVRSWLEPKCVRAIIV